MDAMIIDPRQQRGLLIAQAKRIKRIANGTWFVPSQSSNGGYIVDTEKGVCGCPDHELRGATITCKHRHAVAYARHEITMPDGSTVITEMKVTYSQDWPKYNAPRSVYKEPWAPAPECVTCRRS